MTVQILQSGAVIENDYRYLLWRIWNPDAPQVTFILLNPSTADEKTNDPTIRRCINFAKTWSFGGISVVNLFAYRSPFPASLLRITDPIGPKCDGLLLQAAAQSGCLIAAWGNHGRLHGRDRQVTDLLIPYSDRLFCLGKNRNGSPKHPLYVRRGTERQRFP